MNVRLGGIRAARLWGAVDFALFKPEQTPEHALDECSALGFLDAGVGFAVAAGSGGDGAFELFVVVAKVGVRAQGVAEEDVAAQLRAVRRADVEVMGHPGF
jgi:hypothetical protein